MTQEYRRLMFSDAVRARQSALGSRRAYAEGEGAGAAADRLGAEEAAFIAARDSFYMATVGADGWPYVQHRGGPAGFLRVLDDRHIGFADFRGNRQYISLGNLDGDDRVSLFLMDYPARARLKIIGRMRAVDLREDAGLAEALIVEGYRAPVERGLIVEIAAFDWNCSQHITPRFTAAELAPGIARLEGRIAELEAELAALRQSAG